MSPKGRRITFILVVVCCFIQFVRHSFHNLQLLFIDVDATGKETAVHNRSDIEQASPSRIVRWKSPQELGIEPISTRMRVDQQQQSRQKEPRKQEQRIQVLQRPREDASALKMTTNSTDAYIQRDRGAFARLRNSDPPIAIAEYKLLFFAIPKVGCTVFKQLFRRIAQCPDWRVQSSFVPHNPSHNSLTYLSHYSDDDAHYMMTSPEWTRAAFVRHPMDRVISAYLDKAVPDRAYYGNLSFVTERCCPLHNACGPIAERSFQDFLHVARACPNPHWNSQSRRLLPKYWPYINFIGHLETAQDDAKALLERVGAWEDFGATGWGADGSEPIFGSKSTIVHKTNPQDQMNVFCSKESVAMVQTLYVEDLRNPLFGFRGNGICS